MISTIVGMFICFSAFFVLVYYAYQATHKSHETAETPLPKIVLTAPQGDTTYFKLGNHPWKRTPAVFEGKGFCLYYIREQETGYSWGSGKEGYKKVRYILSEKPTEGDCYAYNLLSGDFVTMSHLFGKGYADGELFYVEKMSSQGFNPQSVLHNIVVRYEEKEGKTIFRHLFNQLEAIENPPKAGKGK